MSRPKSIPAYCLHKPSGQARVILDGKHVYLGLHGSAESREMYARLIAERFRPGNDASPLPAKKPGQFPDLFFNELLLRYTQFAESYYVKDGKPTGEVENLTDAMRPLRALYSHGRVAEFGPKNLKAVRQYMIDEEDLSRGVINARIDRLKRIFKWAVGEELIPPAVYQALATVTGLRYGRCNAREADTVRSVPDIHVQATLAFLPPQVADMIRLQRLTGTRSGSVVLIRKCDRRRAGATRCPAGRSMVCVIRIFLVLME